MLATAIRAVSLLLAATFAWAALTKVVGWRRWREALGHYRLGRGEWLASGAVPAAEALASLLLASGAEKVGGALTLALVSAFSLAAVRARPGEGDGHPCGCFGAADAPDHRLLLLRNGLLAAAGTFVLIAAPGPQLLPPNPSEILPAGLVAVGVVAAAWLVWQTATSLRR